MKDHFIQLFNYDQHTSLLMTEMIMKANNSEKSIQLIAHMLAAQQIWLQRCKGGPTGDFVLWPDWEVDTFEKKINDNHLAWINFLNDTAPYDFDKIINYKNSRGETFENRLRDIITHVINHGTHHRAQIGQLLRLADIDLPYTDYIMYVRALGN